MYKILYRFLLFCLLATVATGCASVIRLPSTTGQIPEVAGGFLKGRTGLDISRSIPVTIINDVSTTPVTRTEIAVGSDRNVIGQAVGLDIFGGSRLDLNLGLLERLDFYVSRSSGLRFQVFGNPHQVGWKGTVFAGMYSSAQTSGTGSEESTQFDASTKLYGWEYGASFGKRVSELSLFYLTLASRGGTADIDILQDQVLTEEYQDKFEHYLTTLGFYYGKTWYLKVELGGNFISWKGSDSTGAPLKDDGFKPGATLGFGYRWGAGESPASDSPTSE